MADKDSEAVVISTQEYVECLDEVKEMRKCGYKKSGDMGVRWYL